MVRTMLLAVKPICNNRPRSCWLFWILPIDADYLIDILAILATDGEGFCARDVGWCGWGLITMAVVDSLHFFLFFRTMFSTLDLSHYHCCYIISTYLLLVLLISSRCVNNMATWVNILCTNMHIDWLTD